MQVSCQFHGGFGFIVYNGKALSLKTGQTPFFMVNNQRVGEVETSLQKSNNAGEHKGRLIYLKLPKYGHGDILWMGKFLRICIYKRQKFEKIHPAKVGWHRSLKLDLAILGGSTFCTFSQKCLLTELEPNQVLNFNAILLLQGKFFQIFAFYKC